MSAAIELNVEDLRGVVSGETLETLERTILPGYVFGRRWYGAKDAGMPTVKLTEVERLDAAIVTVVRVSPTGRSAQDYLLPLTIVEDGVIDPGDPLIIAPVQRKHERGWLVDAFATDGFVQALLASIRSCGAGGGTVRNLRFVRTDALDDYDALFQGPLTIQRSAIEQSNTSLRVGGAIMLKSYRKLDAGIHPELEMIRHLTEIAGFHGTPALLGWIEKRAERDDPTTLCILQAFVPNRGDGWTYVQERLAAMVDGSGDSGNAAESDLLDFARALGARTAGLHRALAIPGDNEAFKPEAVTPDDLVRWTEDVWAMARSSLALLESASLSTAVRDMAQTLLDGQERLRERIYQMAPAGLQVHRTRLHGDYHLGQVLVLEGDVSVIDFEGEPMRPLADRRGKHSPLRDVAGMLRSFDYAASAAQREMASDVNIERRQSGAGEKIASCTMRMSAEFVRSYYSGVKGCASIPDDTEQCADLLRLFLLEKAFYEIGYELANRPDWLDIPLSGVVALLEEPSGRNPEWLSMN